MSSFFFLNQKKEEEVEVDDDVRDVGKNSYRIKKSPQGRRKEMKKLTFSQIFPFPSGLTPLTPSLPHFTRRPHRPDDSELHDVGQSEVRGTVLVSLITTGEPDGNLSVTIRGPFTRPAKKSFERKKGGKKKNRAKKKAQHREW